MRYAIFLHEPDGDMGEGRIVGSFKTPFAAQRKADRLVREAERRDEYAEAIVLPLDPGSRSDRDVVDDLIYGAERS